MPTQRYYQPDGEDDAEQQVCHYCGRSFPKDKIDDHEASCAENDES